MEVDWNFVCLVVAIGIMYCVKKVMEAVVKLSKIRNQKLIIYDQKTLREKLNFSEEEFDSLMNNVREKKKSDK